MAPAREEPLMRRTIGLCFLTATLLASSARAQSIFIDRGDPSAVDVMVGGGLIKDAWGAGLTAGYSYRGVFDVGVDFARYAYTAGKKDKLAGYSVMPFTTWHAIRSDADEMPFSLSFTLGVQRIMYTGSNLSAAPEGWGLVVGPSAYRKIELGTNWVFVPELFAAYEFQYTRYYSGGYSTDQKHGARVLLRPNLLYKAGKTSYVIVPYVGYQGALAVGGNVGAVF